MFENYPKSVVPCTHITFRIRFVAAMAHQVPNTLKRLLKFPVTKATDGNVILASALRIGIHKVVNLSRI